jgi:hypothetical protein
MKTPTVPIVILGGGYTGKVIYRQALESVRRTFITSRDPNNHLTPFTEKHRIWFDLDKRESWNNLPKLSDVIWTFPAISADLIEEFINSKGTCIRRLVLIGSTSAYESGSSREVITVDEESPLNAKIPRVVGEELLRKHLGAILLRSAGIYGFGRNPVDWIRDGRLKNSPRLINFIHVEDLSALALLALDRGTPGDVYNVSDGRAIRLSDLVNTAHARWNVPLASEEKDYLPGKRVSNQKILQTFNYRLRFPDLYAVLGEIQKENSQLG